MLDHTLIILATALLAGALLLVLRGLLAGPALKRAIVVLAVTGLAAATVLVVAQKNRRSPRRQLVGEVVYRSNDTSTRVVALTFDDGPSAEGTAAVLLLLAERDVRATFFLNGADLEREGASAAQLVAAGHELGNHGYRHESLVYASLGRIAREIGETDALIRRAGYDGPIHFRAPYADKLLALPLYLSRQNRRHVTWDVVAEGDPSWGRNASEIARHVVANVQPGSIVLMHVMSPDGEPRRRALPVIIDSLRQRGFRFVTVSELLRQVRPS